MAARRKYWTRHAIFLYVTQRDKSCQWAFRYIPENDRLLVIKEFLLKKKIINKKKGSQERFARSYTRAHRNEWLE